MSASKSFEQWCLVELMGHQKIAGLCSEQTIGGQVMLRVDVPKTNKQEAFSRFYSSSAVYCIHPVSKQIARQLAMEFEQTPISVYSGKRMFEIFAQEGKLELPFGEKELVYDEDTEDEEADMPF